MQHTPKIIEFSPAPHDVTFHDFQLLSFDINFLCKNYKVDSCDYKDAIFIKFDALFIALC